MTRFWWKARRPPRSPFVKQRRTLTAIPPTARWRHVRDSGSQTTLSILFRGVTVGKGAIVREAIIDKYVQIPDGAHIGVDLERDIRRGFTITEGGIVVVPVIEAAEEIFAR